MSQMMMENKGEYIIIGCEGYTLKIPINCRSCGMVSFSLISAEEDPDMEGLKLSIVWGNDIIFTGMGENIKRVFENLMENVKQECEIAYKIKMRKERGEPMDSDFTIYDKKMEEFMRLNGLDNNGGSLALPVHP